MQEGEQHGDRNRPKPRRQQNIAQRMGAGDITEAGPAEKHANRDDPGTEARDPDAGVKGQFDIGGRPESEAEFRPRTEEHRRAADPETRFADNFLRIEPDVPMVGFDRDLRIFPPGIFTPQEQQGNEAGQEADRAEHEAPVHSEGQQTSGNDHCKTDSDRPEGVGDIDIPFRCFGVQILNEGSQDPFADAFAESGKHQTGKQHPVSGGEGAEHDAGPEENQAAAHSDAFPQTGGNCAADQKRRHHENATDHVQHAAGRHPALIQRKI